MHKYVYGYRYTHQGWDICLKKRPLIINKKLMENDNGKNKNEIKNTKMSMSKKQKSKFFFIYIYIQNFISIITFIIDHF